MKTYLLIDTNVYIRSSLFIEKKEDEKLLKSLLSLLESGKLTLILPEIIKLEYQRKLRIVFSDIKRVLSIVSNYIGEKITSPQIKKELLGAISSCRERRDSRIDQVEKVVQKIFSHKNTKTITLSPKIFIASYKRAILGERPSKNKDNENRLYTIQPDCIIVEAAKDYLSKLKGNYRFFICTYDTDYGIIKKDEEPLIHDSIKKEFKHVVLYSKLYKFLNKEFGTKLDVDRLTAEKIPTLSSSVDTDVWVSPDANNGIVSNPDKKFIENYFKSAHNMDLASMTRAQCNRCSNTYESQAGALSSAADRGMCPSCEAMITAGYRSFTCKTCHKSISISVYIKNGASCIECSNVARSE